ncbi:DUF998 domain-containing protein [Nocardia sp. NPDC056100]|uniref:DUF998 domain-containing protein n=1 Tax=Nocardia sp. NPDC056100 TaxID=3345712 RepID=UPI0035E28B78
MTEIDRESVRTPERPGIRPHPVAGVLLIVAPVLWFCLEALVAARFRPRYSYAHNYISDLGVPEPGTFEGRAMDSPLAGVANFMFVSQGLLFLVAAILLTRAIAPSPSRRAFRLLAIGYAIGYALIATFHGSEQAAANGTSKFHVLGGAIAAICGNGALIVAGLHLRKALGRNAFGAFSVAAGVIGILSLVLLMIDRSSTSINLLPDGTWERGGCYPILIWEFVTGALVLVAARQRAR